MEAVDICSLYQRVNIHKAASYTPCSQLTEVTATTSMKLCGIWLEHRRIQTVWVFMHPAVEEIR